MHRKRKIEWLARAEELAHSADNSNKHRLGAILIRRGRVIGKGVNKPFKTHPIVKRISEQNNFQARNGYHKDTIHAELAAMLSVRSSKGCENSTIFVARTLHRTSRPCRHCMQLLKEAGVKKAVYYTETGWAEEEI